MLAIFESINLRLIECTINPTAQIGLTVSDVKGLGTFSEDSIAFLIFNNSSIITPFSIGLKDIS
jgi:hypothetical protein